MFVLQTHQQLPLSKAKIAVPAGFSFFLVGVALYYINYCKKKDKKREELLGNSQAASGTNDQEIQVNSETDKNQLQNIDNIQDTDEKIQIDSETDKNQLQNIDNIQNTDEKIQIDSETDKNQLQNIDNIQDSDEKIQDKTA
ncbi:15247_t:CDS:2 [Entrophospora sp. SA101]|nr:15247_t:CDS:2 [Entrophospora sp. SA101]